MSKALKTFLFFLGLTLVIFIIIFGLRVFHFVKQINQNQSPAFLQNQTKIDSVFLDLKDSPWIGSQKPLMDVVMFCDFECQFCQQSYVIVREFVTQHKENVRLVFRYFPQSNLNPNALLLAQAAACANDQEKFWNMHDKLFQNFGNINLESLLILGEQIGLDIQRFNRCLEEKVHQGRIKQDIKEGVELGVTGTPTWFINGHKTQGVIPLETFEKMIEVAE